jgi:RNA-directed DNA polymerase
VSAVDSTGAFDHLDHGLLLKAGRKHTDCRWVLLYGECWVRALTIPEAGEVKAWQRGTPQGGVLGPLLLHLFLPSAVACWLRRELPTCPFVRYAEDGVVQCRPERQAQEGQHRLATRLRECGVELQPEKTRIVSCKDSKRGGAYPTIQVPFLGCTFRPRRAQNRAGALCTRFLPGARSPTQKRLRQQIAQWHLPRQTTERLRTFSTHDNAIVAGWWQYSGSFYPTEVGNVFRHFALTRAWWARRQSKPLRRPKRRSRRWLAQGSRRESELFVH